MKSRRPKESRSGRSGDQPIVVLDAACGADRNHALQRARHRRLTSAGFCVHGATRAIQAAEVAAFRPDVVLLDRNEPDLCRRLKAGTGNVPIVVLLGSLPSGKSVGTATEMPLCGADLVLPRHVAPAFLIETLKTVFRMRRAEQELDRSRRELVDFSRQIAHDIEGPLRGVVTFAELIGQAHPLSENERTYLGHVLSSADQVRRVARGVMTYAETQRERPSLAVVPLRTVVAAAIHALRERIKESAANLHIQESLPTVLGDFSALQQVIQNLVGNAINYRGRDTSLSITIDAKRGSDESWLISVSDNGIGVAQQYRECIFSPFKRLHGLEIPGAGMGLAICKQIVEAHGGRIWMEPAPEGGASFIFTLRAPA